MIQQSCDRLLTNNNMSLSWEGTANYLMTHMNALVIHHYVCILACQYIKRTQFVTTFYDIITLLTPFPYTQSFCQISSLNSVN